MGISSDTFSFGDENFFLSFLLNEWSIFSEAFSVYKALIDHLWTKLYNPTCFVKHEDKPIVNCSLFNPTPSLSAIVVNKYKLRSNIKSFNLGGMGCSSGVIVVDLAKDLLQVHTNTSVVVVSRENIT